MRHSVYTLMEEKAAFKKTDPLWTFALLFWLSIDCQLFLKSKDNSIVCESILFFHDVDENQRTVWWDGTGRGWTGDNGNKTWLRLGADMGMEMNSWKREGLGTGARLTPHYGWEINPPHLTQWSKIHLVWAEHGDMILLFGPARFKSSIMQLSESPKYWAMCCLHKHTVTLAFK